MKKKILLGVLIAMFLVGAFIYFNPFGQKILIVEMDSSTEDNEVLESVGTNEIIETDKESTNDIDEPDHRIDISDYQNDFVKRLDKKMAIGVFGIDQETTEYGRSDVIMLLVYDHFEESITIISVPRDTMVTIPNYYEDKVNHAYAFGGSDLSVVTLEELFLVKLDYYIVIDFKDFESIIDYIGGIEVDAKKDFDYGSETIVEKGRQTLSGYEALFYVRYRSDSEGDFGRIKRQQEVIESIGYKIKTYDQNVLLDVLNQIYYDYLETDMSLTEMYGYLIDSKDSYTINNYTLETTSKVIDGIWYEIYSVDDLDELREVVKK